MLYPLCCVIVLHWITIRWEKDSSLEKDIRPYLYVSYQSSAMKMCTSDKVDQNFRHHPEYHKSFFVTVFDCLEHLLAITKVELRSSRNK